MVVVLNHTIIFAEDKQKSASLFTTLFDLPDAVAWGPFLIVALGQGGLIQFADANVAIQPQHYAFLLSEEEFDRLYQRILDTGLAHWADPQGSQPGTFNRNHGGRGVYFRDPAGHGLEAHTRPYGGT